MSKASNTEQSSNYLTVPAFAEAAGVSKQAVYDRIKKDLAGYTVKNGGKTMVSKEALVFVGNREDTKPEFREDCGLEQGESINQVDQSSQSSQSIKPVNQAGQADQVEFDRGLTGIEKNSRGLPAESQSSQSSESSCNQSSQSRSQSEKSRGKDLLDYLMEENARLLLEIERKDLVIAEKDASIKEYSARILSLAEQFAALAEREQEISSKALSTTGQAQMLHAMSEQSESAASAELPVEEQEVRPRKWWQRGRARK